MQLPLQIQKWLVSSGISNTGEQDEKSFVTLLQGTATNFDNGFLVGQIIRKLTTDAGRKSAHRPRNSQSRPFKNAKLTNCNFIWLAFDAIGLKLDTRIKELILQGQQALIVEVVRQLYERDEHRPIPEKLYVRMRSAGNRRGHTQAVVIKKINISKDPQQSESSLQFLMLLLKASLGMNLQEILGLFTNQNNYLAHIIMKGVAQSFDSIILFYSLLKKRASKLKAFYQQDSRDSQAFLYALKPGFICKNQNVAQLTLELFGKLGNIYQWFIGQEGKCAGTLLLGLKRHPPLRQLYWHLLLQIIQGEEVDFFAKHFTSSFQNQQEQIQIIGFLVRYISQSWLGEKQSNMGVVATWIQTALKLPEASLEGQILVSNLSENSCFFFLKL